MPQIFLPRRYRSFIHLMPGARPQTFSTARHTATAQTAVRLCAQSGAQSAGRSSIDMYMPQPAADAKLRPILPRPAVCSSAMTTVPSAAPSAASFFK